MVLHRTTLYFCLIASVQLYAHNEEAGPDTIDFNQDIRFPTPTAGTVGLGLHTTSPLPQNATSLDTPGTLVLRDNNGGFAAGPLTINGGITATGTIVAPEFDGVFVGDIHGTLFGHATSDLPLAGGTMTGTINFADTETSYITGPGFTSTSGASLIQIGAVTSGTGSMNTGIRINNVDYNGGGSSAGYTVGDVNNGGSAGGDIGFGVGTVDLGSAPGAAASYGFVVTTVNSAGQAVAGDSGLFIGTVNDGGVNPSYGINIQTVNSGASPDTGGNYGIYIQNPGAADGDAGMFIGSPDDDVAGIIIDDITGVGSFGINIGDVTGTSAFGISIAGQGGSVDDTAIALNIGGVLSGGTGINFENNIEGLGIRMSTVDNSAIGIHIEGTNAGGTAVLVGETAGVGFDVSYIDDGGVGYAVDEVASGGVGFDVASVDSGGVGFEATLVQPGGRGFEVAGFNGGGYGYYIPTVPNGATGLVIDTVASGGEGIDMTVASGGTGLFIEGSTGTSIDVQGATLLGGALALQSSQFSTTPIPISGNNSGAAIDRGASVVLILLGGTYSNGTLTFPPSPIDGQMLYILCASPTNAAASWVVTFVGSGGTPVFCGKGNSSTPTVTLNTVQSSLNSSSAPYAYLFIYSANRNMWIGVSTGFTGP